MPQGEVHEVPVAARGDLSSLPGNVTPAKGPKSFRRSHRGAAGDGSDRAREAVADQSASGGWFVEQRRIAAQRRGHKPGAFGALKHGHDRRRARDSARARLAPQTEAGPDVRYLTDDP